MPKRIIAIANNAKWMKIAVQRLLLLPLLLLLLLLVLGNLQRVNPFALRVLNLRPD